MVLKNKTVIKGKLKVLTGLHIGSGREGFQIGGVDNQLVKIRRGEKEEPYIPGSSLKGKIRSLLEREESEKGSSEKVTDDGLCYCGDCDVCKLFGPARSESIKRQNVLIFRDSYLTQECREKYYKDKNELIEVKAENTIDRKSGTVSKVGPRFTERVVPETEFEVEIVFNEFEGDDKKELLQTLKKGFELLQNDYLGASGTRGYGRVDVSDIISKIDQEIGE